VSRLPDGFEHGRIELIAVVENVNPVSRHERRVGRAGHRGQELRRFDCEVMVESVLRRFLYGVDEKDRDAQQGETENEQPAFSRHLDHRLFAVFIILTNHQISYVYNSCAVLYG